VEKDIQEQVIKKIFRVGSSMKSHSKVSDGVHTFSDRTLKITWEAPMTTSGLVHEFE